MCSNVDLIVQPGLHLPNMVRKFRRDGQSFQVAFVLFTYGCAGSRFVRAFCSCGAHGLSGCGSQALEHRFNSRGTQAWLPHGRWDPPGQGWNPCTLHSATREVCLCSLGYYEWNQIEGRFLDLSWFCF